MYMTFFFQKNPIGVILKIVLALLSLTIGVSGCLLSTVQKTSNKVRASIIKRASHGSGGELRPPVANPCVFVRYIYRISIFQT